jgi:hypothetical protein
VIIEDGSAPHQTTLRMVPALKLTFRQVLNGGRL